MTHEIKRVYTTSLKAPSQPTQQVNAMIGKPDCKPTAGAVITQNKFWVITMSIDQNIDDNAMLAQFY